MKIFVNRKIRRNPWGGGIHFLSGFVDYVVNLGGQITNHFDNDIDAIFMMDPRPDEGFGDINQLIAYKKHLHSIGNKVKLFHRINDTDVARNTNFLIDLNIRANSAAADHTIFISDWLKKHYEQRGFNKNSIVITNGCNHQWFYPEDKLKNDSKIKVVTHHWSDNYNKGFDAYIELDKQLAERDDISFTYIGRYYKGYSPINTKIIEPLYGAALGEQLRNYDLYITAARWEACGMHHIEASSCGLPVIYHKDGGAIGEICNQHCVEFSDVKDVCQIIKSTYLIKDKLKNNIKYELLDNQNVNKMYYNFIKENTKG